METYTVSSEHILLGMGLIPLPTIYKNVDDKTIYVSDTVVTNCGVLAEKQLFNGMPNYGVLIYKTVLNIDELA